MSTIYHDLFVRHSMDRRSGLTLLHRHFSLDADERLVEYRGTSTPWKLNKLAASIRPSSWLLSADGKLRPYEFYHSLTEDSPSLDLECSSQRTFLAEFAQLLSKNNAEGLFGLCRYPGDEFEGRIEVTQGRANINLALRCMGRRTQGGDKFPNFR